MKKRTIVIFVIIFVLLLLVEWGLLQDYDRDDGLSSMSMLINTGKNAIENLDKNLIDKHSVVLGRELTDEEMKEQKELSLISNNIMFSNSGNLREILLSDGTGIIEEDCMYVHVAKDKNAYVFSWENNDILKTYREYSKKSFCNYEKKVATVVMNYEYYVLIPESFYRKDTELIPEKLNIYKIHSPEEGDLIDKVSLITTINCNVGEATGLDYYELCDRIDGYTMSNLFLNYTCNGEEGYQVRKDCILTEKYFTLSEREELLEDISKGRNKKQERDLFGFRKYYTAVEKIESNYWGGEVEIVACSINYNFGMYKNIWDTIWLTLMADIGVACAVAAIMNLCMGRRKEKC